MIKEAPKMDEKDDEGYLNTEDLARILRKDVATIQRWCRDGVIPTAKLGRSYMIRKCDFDEWYEEQKKRPVAAAKA